MLIFLSFWASDRKSHIINMTSFFTLILLSSIYIAYSFFVHIAYLFAYSYFILILLYFILTLSYFSGQLSQYARDQIRLELVEKAEAGDIEGLSRTRSILVPYSFHTRSILVSYLFHTRSILVSYY